MCVCLPFFTSFRAMRLKVRCPGGAGGVGRGERGCQRGACEVFWL